jgi:outer membrane protein insertion porin family
MMTLMLNFKKIFFTIFIYNIFLISASYAEVIKKVDVQGNERISKETILIYGDVSIGKNYETSDLNLIIKKLFESNFFSNISVKLENNKLSIVVEENPLIDEIVFDGAIEKHIEPMRELLILRDKSSFTENSIKHDINQIKSFYRVLGFYFVKIDTEVEKLEKNKVKIVFTIDKGKKAKISKIFFLGDKKLRDKKLRDVITSQEAKFWKFLSRSVYLNDARIELDKRLLKNYYRNKGFYEASVTSSNVEYLEGEGFVLTYSINAGDKYRFSKIFANVSEGLDKSAFISLEPEFSKLVGKLYSQEKLNSVLEKIDKLTEQKELQFINHNISETLGKQEVEVKINIFEGQKFLIERINIVGNSVTNDSVIRGEMIVDEGDPFSELLVNKSINYIKARRIFGAVNYKMLPGTSDDLKILEINVEEQATGEIMAGAGIGTDGTSVSFAISENNWLGKGVKLKTALNLSEEKISGEFKVKNPNYKFTGNAVNAGVDISSSDRAASGFKSSKTGFEIGTGFEQYENLFFSPNLTLAFEDIEVDSSATSSIKKMEGNFFNVDFEYGLTLDKRNRVYQPTEGYKTSFFQTLPIIQDSSAIKNGLDVHAYRAFSDDVIGTIKFHSRAINGIDDDVRLSNRLYLPRKMLRGFNTNKTGPKDGEDYIGGNYTTALSAEAQLPNLLPESYRTDISLFMDTGNVWAIDYNDSLNDTNKIRSSIGIGANVYTTIGPLSFVLAQSLTKSSEDETESFNFQLGTSF